MTDMTSVMYDSLAKHYRSYSEKRNAYLMAVDRFVLSALPNKAKRLLDVGAADGIRGMRIARTAQISETVLCDSSHEMIGRCEAQGASSVLLVKAEELPTFAAKFDVVLMLWNVLGHLDSREKRVEALRRIAHNMNETSVFFLDVNNRHNGPAYGWNKVLFRVLIDAIRPDEARGDVSFTWEVDGKMIPGKGHLFTLAEVRSLLDEAGLKIRDAVFIDYKTGAVTRNRLRGQIVLKVTLK